MGPFGVTATWAGWEVWTAAASEAVAIAAGAVLLLEHNPLGAGGGPRWSAAGQGRSGPPAQCSRWVSSSVATRVRRVSRLTGLPSGTTAATAYGSAGLAAEGRTEIAALVEQSRR